MKGFLTCFPVISFNSTEVQDVVEEFPLKYAKAASCLVEKWEQCVKNVIDFFLQI